MQSIMHRHGYLQREVIDSFVGQELQQGMIRVCLPCAQADTPKKILVEPVQKVF